MVLWTVGKCVLFHIMCNCSYIMYLTLQMVGIGDLEKKTNPERGTLSCQQPTQGGFLHWKKLSTLKVGSVIMFFYSDRWIGISWMKWENIHCRDHRSSRSQMVLILRGAFSHRHPRCCRLWQLKTDRVCEVKPGIWSKPNLRQMGYCTCCYICVCVFVRRWCVFLLIFNPGFLELLKEMWENVHLKSSFTENFFVNE